MCCKDKLTLTFVIISKQSGNTLYYRWMKTIIDFINNNRLFLINTIINGRNE